MQPKFTLKNMRNVFKPSYAFVVLLTLSILQVNAQQYINGPISTGATTQSGVSAPAGTTWSEVQNNTGNTSVSNTNAGIATQAGTFRLADNFTVPAGPNWTVSKISTFAYQTGSPATPTPFTSMVLQIWNGRPGDPGSAVIFGDLTTNRLSASVDANMFRVFNTVAPPPGTAPGTTRKIWRNEANIPALVLAPGTYWIEWATVVGATATTAHFAPTKTIVGSRGAAGDNARQLTVATGVWADVVDQGNPITPPSVPQDFPFIVDFTTSACAGTPAPGNTISTAASVCPADLFTLSLQNATSGGGVTYQWQTSATATGPWAPAPGTNTNPTYTGTQTAATFYRCAVTCATGPATGNSNPLQVALNPPTSCYCLAGATSTAFEKISNVTFNTINNNSTSTAGYENFTAISSPAYRGTTTPITVTISGPFASDQVFVWIDFNQDGDFTDPGENVFTSAQGVGPHTGNIAIPATALSGPTRMRVRMHDAAFTPNATPCGNSGFGQVEDYTVNIQDCVPVSFTSNPASAAITCGTNTSFTVANTGSSVPVTYTWQFRTSSAGAWQTITGLTNPALYGGINSATLTLTNVTAPFSGYQYRALATNPCAGPIFSNEATLTVNPIVPVVNPASPTICVGTVQQLSLTNTLGDANLISEGFEGGAIPAGWNMQNLSTPIGSVPTWVFNSGNLAPAQNGTATSYALGNFNNVAGNNTISNWLITPAVAIKNGDVLRFWTRTVTAPLFPDRLEVRMNTSNTTNVGATNISVGDFTNLLLTVNAGLTTTGYPNTWTQFTATVSGLASPVPAGRFAFRYFVTNGGPLGANSDNIGIDNVVFTSTGGAAQGAWTGNLATMWLNSAANIPYTTGTLANSIWVTPAATSTYGVTFSTLAPCASANTNVTVTVNNPAVITSTGQPVNAAACRGANATFAVGVTGGPIAYQWQESRDNGLSWNNITNGGIYGGATTATLTLTGVTDASAPVNMNGFRYRVNMTVASCSGTVTTNGNATLTVNPLPAVGLTATDLLLTPGNPTGQFSTITATSTPAATSYIWTRNLAALTSGTPAVPVTGSSYVADIDGLGTYNVRSVTAAGCTSSAALSASITIGAEPSERLWIYPNPSPGAFQVRYYFTRGASFVEGREVKIYNALGQEVTSKNFLIANSTPQYMRMDFDLSNMAKGTYVVKLIEKNKGLVASGLVVVL